MIDRIEELKKHLQLIVEDPGSAGIFYVSQESMDLNGAKLLETRALLDNAKEYLTVLEFCTKNSLASDGLEMIHAAMRQ